MKSHELMKPTKRTFFLSADLSIHGEVLRWMHPLESYRKQSAMVVIHIEDESGLCTSVLEPSSLDTVEGVVFYRHHRDCKTDQRDQQRSQIVQEYRETLT